MAQTTRGHGLILDNLVMVYRFGWPNPVNQHRGLSHRQPLEYLSDVSDVGFLLVIVVICDGYSYRCPITNTKKACAPLCVPMPRRASQSCSECSRFPYLPLGEVLVIITLTRWVAQCVSIKRTVVLGSGWQGRKIYYVEIRKCADRMVTSMIGFCIRRSKHAGNILALDSSD